MQANGAKETSTATGTAATALVRETVQDSNSGSKQKTAKLGSR